MRDSAILNQAKSWLASLLASGPMPSTDVIAAAKQNGFSEPTVRRAKKKIQASSIKQINDDRWWWAIGTAGPSTAQGAIWKESNKVVHWFANMQVPMCSLIASEGEEDQDIYCEECLMIHDAIKAYTRDAQHPVDFYDVIFSLVGYGMPRAIVKQRLKLIGQIYVTGVASCDASHEKWSEPTALPPATAQLHTAQ